MELAKHRVQRLAFVLASLHLRGLSYTKDLVLIKTFCQQNKTTSFTSLCRSRYLKTERKPNLRTARLRNRGKNNSHRNVKTAVRAELSETKLW